MSAASTAATIKALAASCKLPETCLQQAQLMELPAHNYVFHEGSPCESFMLVTEGCVRVQKLSESGREIVLYRVESGQTCVLTSAGLISGQNYQAEAVTESAVKALVLGRAEFQQALAQSDAFRQFVFAAFADRLSGLLMLIDAVAFGRMDARLASLLLEKIQIRQEIQLTHQDLAYELGTAREVVSRLLKEFERKQWLSLGRGRIEVVSVENLRQLSARVFS